MSRYLIGNWKLHKNKKEISDFFEGLAASPVLATASATEEIMMGVAVSPTHLDYAVSVAPSGMQIFSQNVAGELSGAFTGEISADQLVDLGVVGTLVGHSERRSLFAESAESAAKRAQQALSKGLKVVFCIGESLEEREQGQTERVLKDQLDPLVNLLSLQALERSVMDETLWFAYEPVWAIGTGRSATPQMAQDTHAWVRSYLSTRLVAAGGSPGILYGGSVKPSNFKDLLSMPDIAGGLVGGASLEATSYLQLLKCLTPQADLE